MFQTMGQIIESIDQRKKEKYPEIKMEGFWLNDSFTGRISAVNAYEFTCKDLSELHCSWIPHLMEKNWFIKELYFDLVDLAKQVLK